MRSLPLDRRAGDLTLRTENRNVIVSGLGTKSMHAASWFDVPEDVTFDLVGTYYGTEEAAADFSCAECVVLYRCQGTKWMLFRALVRSKDWRVIVDTYEAFLLADDDLIMSAGVIARSFALFDAYGLQLAQPSVCAHSGSAANHETLRQRAGTRLRYTAFVEVQMPLATRETLVGVIQPTLRDAHTGWGLDYVWPYLLGYPHDGIAVIDDVCALHPASQPGKQSTYALKHPAGLEPWDEYLATIAAWGLNASSMARRGVDVPGVLDTRNVVWGSIPKTAPLPADAHCDARTGLGLPGGPRCALLAHGDDLRGDEGRLASVQGTQTARDTQAGNAIALPAEAGAEPEPGADGSAEGAKRRGEDGERGNGTRSQGKKNKRGKNKKSKNKGKRRGRKDGAAGAEGADGRAPTDADPSHEPGSQNATSPAASAAASPFRRVWLSRVASEHRGAVNVGALVCGVALGGALAARYAARRAAGRPGGKAHRQGAGGGGRQAGGAPPGLLAAALPSRAIAALFRKGAAKQTREGRGRFSSTGSSGTLTSSGGPTPEASRSSVNGA